MMIDADVVAASPSSVYRVLKQAKLLNRWAQEPSAKGQGFQQPERPHEHWHIDVAYINICGTFYYLCSILHGYSRYLVHWEIRETMTEADVEIIVQRARERVPEVKPRIISDNGPQFVARGFKTFIRQCGMSHVRTSPYYPQSNGKIERWHKSLKRECIRPGTPLSLEDGRQLVNRFVMCYNQERLHSAIGYVTPKDKLEGREPIIFAERKRKLAAARKRRSLSRSKAEPRAPRQSGRVRIELAEPCPL
jgi:putative transposase